ncbi:MAG TPA: chalcone isomerase family protein [Polyangium sp.]|nr:chalcone isomerase family protein [Polyangium sp.]
MKFTRAKFFSFLAAIAAMFVVSGAAIADDWLHTGSGIRVKTILVVDVNVYSISHFMSQRPAEKSKSAVIEADVNKKFECKMLRDLEGEKLKTALKDAYAKNNYTDQAKIGKVLGAFTGDLKEGQRFSIKYDAEKKTTTFNVDGQGSVTVDGADFMKGTWSIWFGNIDQKNLGNQLIAKL